MEAWRTTWAVSVDGQDVTSRFNPYLQSIDINDKDGSSSDTASLVFDDTEAQIKLPKSGGLVAISIEGVDVFKGTVDEIQSTGARGQGRIITVSAKGFDSRGKVKAPLDFHRDDVSLQEFLAEVAKRAGLAGIVVDPAFAEVIRDYWSADTESFIHLGERIAREFGGTFKIRGDRAVLARRGEGVAPSGKPLPGLTAAYGDNLLSWDISPFVGRHRAKKAKVGYFDRPNARYDSKDVTIDIPDDDSPDATTTTPYSAADADSATTSAGGKKNDSQRKSGEGSVTLILTPEARVEGSLTVQGIRPGIDGAYRISGVSHRLQRSGGSTTELELKQPGSGTGASGDKRTPAFDTEAFIANQARVTTQGSGIDNT